MENKRKESSFGCFKYGEKSEKMKNTKWRFVNEFTGQNSLLETENASET